jgi:hypothetical protein
MNRKETKRKKDLEGNVIKIMTKLYEGCFKGNNWDKATYDLLNLFEGEIKKERKLFEIQNKKEKDLNISRINILEGQIKNIKIKLSKVDYQRQITELNKRVVEKQLQNEQLLVGKVKKELEEEKEKNRINGSY